MEISGRFVGLFSRNGVFLFRNLGRIIVLGENCFFWGGFINMHSFLYFYLGITDFLIQLAY